jgi:hypothetical protein
VGTRFSLRPLISWANLFAQLGRIAPRDREVVCSDDMRMGMKRPLPDNSGALAPRPFRHCGISHPSKTLYGALRLRRCAVSIFD